MVIDCEASGFGKDSYPIEVGFVCSDGKVVSDLIRPESNWTHWNECSAKVHNIPRKQLFEEGIFADELAQKLNVELNGLIVYSDAPEYEQFWLSRLYEAASINISFDIEHLFHIFIQHQHKYFYDYKKELRTEVIAHRAGNDAFVLQQAFIRSRQKAVDLHHKCKH